jgi:subtilisin family serine protease
MRQRRALGLGIALAGIVLVPAAGAPAAAPSAGDDLAPAALRAQRAPASGKLDPRLARLARSPAALRTARALALTAVGKRVRVVVEARAEGVDAARRSVEAAGGRIEAVQGGLVQALVPPGGLEELAASVSVARVRPPFRPVFDAVPGEGVNTTNAPAWHRVGLVGAGVRVAVIDGGFAGLAERQASGDIPAGVRTVDFCGGNFNGPENHGTAVAEIVAEQAPGAELHLICMNSEVTLAQAEAYVKANRIAVVNHSVSWFNTWRGDGRGPAGTPDAIVADARANGVLWVNSAGNQAQRHWGGTFASADADGVHEFAPGDELDDILVAGGGTVCALLRWDNWPIANDDYDLFIVDPFTNTILAVSEGDQIRDRLPPTEEACFENGRSTTRQVAFAILRFAGSSAANFDLYGLGDVSNLQHSVAARSIGDPAASPNALAVGAVCWQSGVLETFSAQGPTIDARTKPDLSAPDSVSSATYGGFRACAQSGFPGTSASSPYAAGTAALAKQRFPAMNVAELHAYLLTQVADAGPAGVDNGYGAGRISLSAIPAPGAQTLPSTGRFGQPVRLRFRVTGATWPIRERVEVFRGARRVARIEVPFAATRDGAVRTATWRAPRVVPGQGAFRFCVRAFDRAGVSSPLACGPLRMRR